MIENALKNDLVALTAALRNREISSVELTEAYLSAIGEKNGEMNAYITVAAELALAQAGQADRLLDRGEGGVLCGVPYSLKDNIAAAGLPLTCGSEMLRHFVPPYSAAVTERLRDSGAVLLGKTNLDEFAMGSSTEKSLFGPTRNPLDLTRVPGGSSGGAAASVAGGMAAFALGSDTGGSARQPAAFCGLVAMKPTYGRVSRFGLVETASSLEQICPITKTVRDNALVLSVIAGQDCRDMTTLEEGLSLTLDPAVTKGLQVGILTGYEDFCSPDAVRCVNRVGELFRSLGGTTEGAELPSPALAEEIYMIVMSAEVSSNLSRYDGIKYGRPGESPRDARSGGFGEEVRRRILTGTYALSSVYKGDYYRKIKLAQNALVQQTEALLERFNLLVLPTVPDVAFPLGAYDGDPTRLYGSDRFTVYANLTGCPCITLPCGGSGGLPLGVSLMGREGEEPQLYGAALALEEGLREIVKKEVRVNG